MGEREVILAAGGKSLWSQFFLEAGLPLELARKYGLIFAENRMRLGMLEDLDKTILKDMGVTAVGDVIAVLRYAKVVLDKVKSGDYKVPPPSPIRSVIVKAHSSSSKSSLDKTAVEIKAKDAISKNSPLKSLLDLEIPSPDITKIKIEQKEDKKIDVEPPPKKKKKKKSKSSDKEKRKCKGESKSKEEKLIKKHEDEPNKPSHNSPVKEDDKFDKPKSNHHHKSNGDTSNSNSQEDEKRSQKTLPSSSSEDEEEEEGYNFRRQKRKRHRSRSESPSPQQQKPHGFQISSPKKNKQLPGQQQLHDEHHHGHHKPQRKSESPKKSAKGTSQDNLPEKPTKRLSQHGWQRPNFPRGPYPPDIITVNRRPANNNFGGPNKFFRRGGGHGQHLDLTRAQIDPPRRLTRKEAEDKAYLMAKLKRLEKQFGKEHERRRR